MRRFHSFRTFLAGFAVGLAFAMPASPAQAASHYKKALHAWTRSAQVFTVDNLEARLYWSATYASDEFLREQREFMAKRYEWSDEELRQRLHEEREAARDGESFIVTIYAGSSKWPEIGKEDTLWRMALETSDGRVFSATKFERLPITQVERETYPHLDSWSRLYRVSFKNAPRLERPFHLKLLGIPAHSTLSW